MIPKFWLLDHNLMVTIFFFDRLKNTDQYESSFSYFQLKRLSVDS